MQVFVLSCKWVDQFCSGADPQGRFEDIKKVDDKSMSKLISCDVVAKTSLTLNNQQYVVYYDVEAANKGLPNSVVRSDDGMGLFGTIVLVQNEGDVSVSMDEQHQYPLCSVFGLLEESH